jgi:hypothetical protein
METVDNNYRWKARYGKSYGRHIGGDETLTVSALHRDPDEPAGVVAHLEGGREAHNGRAVVNPDTGQGTPEQIWIDEDTKKKVLGDDSSYEDFEKANKKQGDFERRHNDGLPMSQGTLFDYAPPQESKAPVLTILASTKGTSHLVPSVLGHAGLESLSRYGHLPIPDDSLSGDSAKIVQRLVKHGALSPNPNNPESLPNNSVGRGITGESLWSDIAVSQEKKNVIYTENGQHSSTLKELDPMVGSQFLRERLVAAKKQPQKAADGNN